MQIKVQLIQALIQVLIVLGLSFIIYGIHWIFSLKKSGESSFFKYLGFQSAHAQFDKFFWFIWTCFIVFAVSSAFLEYNYSLQFRQMLTDQSSPYAKILNNGFTFHSATIALIYCFVMAGASEEILFRGLIARRLFSAFSFMKANFLQALIFWAMHLFIVRLVTGYWISSIQLVAFVTSFGMGLVLGYANFRNGGKSIYPSWVLHGSANFFTFLTLGYLWRK
jgi:membrane protease YdiL (CAAX protease family)